MQKDALKSAKGLSEPNRRVSVSAWAVRAMTKRNDIEIGPVVDELLEAIEHEPNPVRRADALVKLFSAVYPKKEFRGPVLSPLLNACSEMRSWKRPIILTDIALILAEEDPNGPECVVKMIGSESGQRKARKQIDEGRWLGPYEFIPFYTKHGVEK